MALTPDQAKADDRMIETAAAWFVRLRRDDVSETELEAFTAWLRSDPRHRQSFEETERLWADLEAPAHAAARDGRHRPAQPRAATRGATWAMAAAMLAAFVVGGAYWRDQGFLDRMFADYSSSRGEQRQIGLPDGSIAFLDGDSALDVAFTGSTRKVKMLRGRVWFDVTHDAARPFEVAGGDADIRVLGTAFAVTMAGADETEVTVERGLVSVTGRDGSAAKLEAGEAIAVAAGRMGEKTRVEPEVDLGWRRGLAVLNAAPFAKVVEELNRVSSERVVVASGSLDGLRLSGVFKINRPDELLAALRSSLGVKMLRVPGVATILYR